MIPKFRAWDKVFKEMVQVNALVLDEQVVKVTYKNGNVAKEDMKEYELMQSTGLKDKNGKEIFEGDILKSNKYITSVFYERGAYCVKFRRTTNTTVTMNVISFIEKYKTKILGNIYENPELLEVPE